jgi:leader peptidase (prepilin peptidase) / N-methyltransferase
MASMIANVVWAVLAGLLGLAVGSFLNVVIYRLPADESVVRPASRCPQCKAEIRTRHNIPVLGWFLLRGKCFDCNAPISARYPIIEALTGLLFAAVTVRILDRHLAPALPAYLYFVAAAIALAVIDVDHKRLPDKITLPSYPVLAILLTVAAATQHDWWSLARAGIGTAALYAFYYAIAFAYPAGMGFGDVKLAGLLGGVLAYLSWSALAVGAFLGFLLGALGGVAVMVSGRGGRKTPIPFGPFMIAGALLAVFVARPLADAYIELVQRG